jgi:hypothetical protein
VCGHRPYKPIYDPTNSLQIEISDLNFHITKNKRKYKEGNNERRNA